MAIEVSHCGSGCTVGDFISEWVIYALAVTIAGYAIFAEYIGDYVLAVAFGIVFQYFAIAPMRGLGVRDGLNAAAKADSISLTFFEIGLFGWMALMTFVVLPGAQQSDAKLDRLLVPHADRHDHRLLHLVAGERVAGQARHQGADVDVSGPSIGGRPHH